MRNFIQSRKFKLAFSVLTLIIAVSQIILSVLPYIFKEVFFDFSIYLTASNQWISGKIPYQSPFGDGKANVVPFNYPPASLYFLSLFTLLPFPENQILFTLLIASLFIFSFFVLNKLLKPRLKMHYLLAIIGLALLTFPFKFTVVMGQINGLILLLVISAYFFYDRRRKNISSVLLAFAACFKFYPILLLVLFISRKDFRYIIQTGFLFFLFNLTIPSLFFPYFFKVFPTLFSSIPDFKPYNQSIYAFFIRLGIGYPDARLASNLVAVSLLLGVLYVNLKRSLVRSYFMLFALLSIVGQFSWQHHLMYAFPFVLIYFRKTHYLLAIFLLFAFHFLDYNSTLTKNPFIVSYQTIGLIGMLLYAIYLELRAEYTNKKIPYQL